jgi:hypothetical protein
MPFHSTFALQFGKAFPAMPKSDPAKSLSWPWWAPWALLAVALTSLLTIAATLYDIL